MQLVAVIDLMGGCVVRARRGERQNYRPMRSRLCDGADALTVVAALAGSFPVAALYVADLDAILERGDNRAALERLRAAFLHLPLWLDAGAATLRAYRDLLDGDAVVPVLGSESLRDAGEFERAMREAAEPILSLDFRGGRFLGPPQVLAQAQSWPSRVLAMNLDRVGSGAGPDLELLQSLRARAPQCGIYLAGGVRDRDDLAAACEAGAAGVLIASALHDGTLTAADFALSL